MAHPTTPLTARPDVSAPGDGASHRHDVVVIGSGVAGLTAAAAARRAGASVLVVDGPAPDGRAATEQREGYALNRGPHALYDRAAGRAVLDGLGISLTGEHPPIDYVLVDGDREAPFSQRPRALVQPFLGTTDKVRLGRLMARIARTDPATVADRTAERWLAESLPPAPRAVAAMLVRVATYCADLDLVSADVAVGQVKAAVRGVTYLDGGWAQLTRALRDAAPGVEHRTGKVRRIEPGADGPTVHTDTAPIAARRVVLAAGSPRAAAALLPGGAPLRWARLGPAVTAACLDLALTRPPVDEAWFGIDRPLYLAPHAPRAALAPDGRGLVHVMRNLRHDEEAAPDHLRGELRQFARRAGIAEDDVAFERYLHHMVVVSAMVTPDGGGLAGRPAVTDTATPGVLVAGDWVGPSGWLADASLVSGDTAGALAARQARSLRGTGSR